MLPTVFQPPFATTGLRRVIVGRAPLQSQMGRAGGEGRGCISIAVVGGEHTNTLHSDWMQIEAQSFHPLLLQGNGNRIRMVETAAENVL